MKGIRYTIKNTYGKLFFLFSITSPDGWQGKARLPWEEAEFE